MDFNVIMYAHSLLIPNGLQELRPWELKRGAMVTQTQLTLWGWLRTG